MNLIFENESEDSFDFDAEKLAAFVIEGALDNLGLEYEAQVSLTLVENDEIHEINKEQRNIDAPTDVLSFPMAEFEKPGDFSKLEEDMDNFDPDTGEFLLGDIVINTNRVKSQALEYGHSEKREYAFLIVHSILHLCGFDHMTPEEAKVMEDRQRIILDGMEIYR